MPNTLSFFFPEKAIAGTAPPGSLCAPRFSYEGAWYEGCTLVNNPRPWCALTKFYNGLWGVCGGKLNIFCVDNTQ